MRVIASSLSSRSLAIRTRRLGAGSDIAWIVPRRGRERWVVGLWLAGH
jgi:hypothetical protein